MIPIRTFHLTRFKHQLIISALVKESLPSSAVAFTTHVSLRGIFSDHKKTPYCLYSRCDSRWVKKRQNYVQPSNCVARGYATQPEQSVKDDAAPGHLVYQGRVGGMFRLLKIFSLSTSAIGLSLQPYLAYTYQDMPLVAAVPFFAAINVFVFVNPILIHFIAKKYVMELYFNPDTRLFTAAMLTFFARKQMFTFTADDVKIPDVPGMFSMLTAKDRPLFVMEPDFTDMEVYKHLMGFDKPLDLSFKRDL